MAPAGPVTAEGNVSRLRMVELVLEQDVPVGVRRGEVVLAPDEPWERGGGRGVTDDRHSIWASFVLAEAVEADLRTLVLLDQHRPVASPQFPFESTKIGAGPPPIRVPEGWLLIHHGVSEHDTGGPVPRLDYAAGAMLLDGDDITRVLFRTTEPVLAPETTEEKAGVDRHIVFPSGLARIGDAHYVFYGVSDRYIGVARLEQGPAPWQAIDPR